MLPFLLGELDLLAAGKLWCLSPGGKAPPVLSTDKNLDGSPGPPFPPQFPKRCKLNFCFLYGKEEENPTLCSGWGRRLLSRQTC